MFRHQKGFSLAEVSIATLIIGTGLVSVGKLQSALSQGNMQAKQHSHATMLAQDKIEALRKFTALETDSTSTMSNRITFDSIGSGQDSVNSASTTYTRTWQVVNSTSPEYKTINMTVNWTTSDNQSKSLTINSMLSRVDPAISGEIITFSERQPAVNFTQTQVSYDNNPSDQNPEDANAQPVSTTVTDEHGNQLQYDENSQLVTINSLAAYNISGSVTLATGGSSPGTNSLDSLSIVPSNTTGAKCHYTGTTGQYTCSVSQGWSGSLAVTGSGTDIVCSNTSMPISNVQQNHSGVNLQLIKSSKTCDSTHPVQLN
jgi:prepilin-type N-terminal cleavage/methylation domain-containing protein